MLSEENKTLVARVWLDDPFDWVNETTTFELLSGSLNALLDAAREEGRQSPRPLPVGVEEAMALKLTAPTCARCGRLFPDRLSDFCYMPECEHRVALSPPSDGGGA